MDILYLKGIKTESLIGIHEHERLSTQPLIIDLELGFDASKAAHSESIDDTIDYDGLTNCLCEWVSQQTFQLLETLAETIANRLIAQYPIFSVTVRIEKPNILHNVGSASICIKRSTKECATS